MIMLRSLFCSLVLAIALGLTALSVIAQTSVDYDLPRGTVNAQITGQVRYANGGAPAHNVVVELTNFQGGGNIQVQTDRNGKFTFQNIQATRCNVTVRMSGFREEQQYVDLSTTPTQYVQFTLRPDGTSRAGATASPGVVNTKAPTPAQQEYEAGLAAINQGQAEKGIAHLEKAISLYAGFTQAHLLVGTAYIDTKQWEKAEVSLRRAIELDPKSMPAHYALGEMYQQQKKYQEAEKAIKEGLKVEERSWQGHFALGRLYWEMNDLVKAGREVAKTLQLKPDLAEAHLLGGNILLRARKNEDALYEFQEYLRLEPEGKFAPQARELVAKIQKALAEQKK
jgi:Flp pilus assembly protein TadD